MEVQVFFAAMELKKGYELTYEWVIKLLKDCDFTESAARLGLKQTAPDEVLISFLGKTYKVTKQKIELAVESGESGEKQCPWNVDSEEFDFNLKSVLGYYVLSEGKTGPLDDFCPITHFSHGIFRDDAEWQSDTVAAACNNDYQKFHRAAEKLGFVFEVEKSPGQYVWRYPLFPRMPVKIVYYEGDEEYPTKVQVLFDKTAIEYYKFEPLAVLYMCFLSALAAAAAAA